MGEAMFAISAAWAQLERGIISERIRSGMARAFPDGTRLGRPTVGVDLGLVVKLWDEGRYESDGVGGKGGGVPGRIRTRDPLLRRQLLYPSELQGHVLSYPFIVMASVLAGQGEPGSLRHGWTAISYQPSAIGTRPRRLTRVDAVDYQRTRWRG